VSGDGSISIEYQVEHLLLVLGAHPSSFLFLLPWNRAKIKVYHSYIAVESTIQKLLQGLVWNKFIQTLSGHPTLWNCDRSCSVGSYTKSPPGHFPPTSKPTWVVYLEFLYAVEVHQGNRESSKAFLAHSTPFPVLLQYAHP